MNTEVAEVYRRQGEPIRRPRIEKMHQFVTKGTL